MISELADNDFVLFELPPRFAQDRAVIDMRWKALQSQLHPDRFAAEGAAAQRMAMQWSVRVNEAYGRLKDPMARASYLCRLNGHDVHGDPAPPMPPAFLMQQMELHEVLEEALTAERIEVLGRQIDIQRQALENELGVLIDEHADWPAAAARVRALMFVSRLASEIERRMDACP